MNTTQEQADILHHLKDTTMNPPQAPTLPVMSLTVLRKGDQQARDRENRLAKNRIQSFDVTMTDVEHLKGPIEPILSQPSGFVTLMSTPIFLLYRMPCHKSLLCPVLCHPPFEEGIYGSFKTKMH
jgi:hypothetical protein